MADPIRYYMDQHYDGAVTKALRQLGIDVLTAHEAGRCGLPTRSNSNSPGRKIAPWLRSTPIIWPYTRRAWRMPELHGVRIPSTRSARRFRCSNCCMA